jgi:BlaI family transcriptional regulator, penicillinase repressor
MPRKVHVSNAELAVLQALWSTGPTGLEEVMAALPADVHWHESTVKTLLSRLLKKGAVGATRQGRRFRYSARLTRDQWLATESKSLLDRFFGGRVSLLVAYFSQRQKLSAADVADLRKLVAELDDE